MLGPLLQRIPERKLREILTRGAHLGRTTGGCARLWLLNPEGEISLHQDCIKAEDGSLICPFSSVESPEHPDWCDRLSLFSEEAFAQEPDVVSWGCSKQCRGDCVVHVTPVRYGGRIAGFVAASGLEGHEQNRQFVQLAAWNIEDILKLHTELDSHAGEIVHNYEEIAVLYEMSHALSGVVRLQEACEVVLEYAMLAIDAEKTSLMLLDRESNELSIIAAEGLPVQIIPEVRVKVGEGICGHVAETGEPLLINEATQQLLPSLVSPNRYKTESFLSFPVIVSPMMVKRRVVGVINMTDKREGTPFTSGDLKLLNAIATQAAIAITNAQLYDELETQFFDTIEALVSAIDARDPYTHGHSHRVTDISLAVARVMKLSDEILENIRLAALLHDTGKIGTPEHILHKPDKLDQDEWIMMRQHPECGAEIIQHIQRLREGVVDGVRHHHERFDGSGYPDRLVEEQIPIVARTIAVADAFDAMTSDRPYRKAMDVADAIRELKQHGGTQFDDQVVRAFMIAHKKGEVQ